MEGFKIQSFMCYCINYYRFEKNENWIATLYKHRHTLQNLKLLKVSEMVQLDKVNVTFKRPLKQKRSLTQKVTLSAVLAATHLAPSRLKKILLDTS